MKPPSLSDIEESKVNNVLKDLKNVIAKNNLGKYVGYIDKILEDVHLENQENYITTIDIAAALLKTLVTQNSKNDFSQADTYNYEDTGAEKGMVRLFVNMGRKDRIQPKHIVEAIASRTSLSGKLIGAIDIFDKFSFVDIPYEYVDEVLSPSKNFRIKGKKLTVEKANRK